ncbi:hypothetical protein ACIRQY_01520 [Streptomyces sp. NPDC101490]|uniref:hypothetical protein n=1 Tax=Streptomyces sp. NPDC101490 TaxID=3366143 RepID=UPI0037F85EAB
MRTHRLVKSTGLAVSAIFLATAPAVSGDLLAGAGSLAETTGRNVADHGWGRFIGIEPAAEDGLLALAGGTEDHGWG